MDPEDFPTPDAEVQALEPDTLRARIDDGEPVTILDVRMESEYEKWRIEGETVETTNVPYYEFLDEDVGEDVFEALPADDEFVVVCAKGGASEYVAGLLLEEDYDVTHLEAGMNGWANVYEAVEVTGYEGVGWGLSGICPGAAYASVGIGNLPILWAVAGMFLGAYLQGVWRSRSSAGKPATAGAD